MNMTAIQALERSKTILDDVTDRLLTKGYYMPPSYTEWGMDWQDVIIPEVTLRKFARRVAKEAKRPFVQVGKLWGHRMAADGSKFENYQTGIWIEMPKRNYLAPLIHPVELAGFYQRGFDTLWHFNINDMEFATQYLSFFETREEFRKALKLPVK